MKVIAIYEIHWTLIKPQTPVRCRARREQLKWYDGLSAEGQNPNLVLTVSCFMCAELDGELQSSRAPPQE